MRIENEYPDVMQNLEYEIACAYRQHPEMADYAALRVYEALVETYCAERAGRPPRLPPLTDLERELAARVHRVCEWRLGRAELDDDRDLESPADDDPLPLETLILCLKRLVKSVNTWTRRSGRQGYLAFMAPYTLGELSRS